MSLINREKLIEAIRKKIDSNVIATHYGYFDGIDRGLRQAKSIVEEQPTMDSDSGWIACEDRLPVDETITYLVCLKNGGIFLAVYIIDEFVMISPAGTRRGKTKDIEVMFRNGYSKNSPTLFAKVRLTIGYGNPEWGAEQGKNYYILHIKEVNRHEKL